MPKGRDSRNRPSKIHENKALEKWLEQQQNSGRNEQA
jgi:hypothetical protein